MIKKFFIRLIINLFKLLVISIPLEILGIMILLIYLPLNPNVKKLPNWLKWFDGADQYFGRSTETYNFIMSSSWWDKYIWLAWRNPCNYFGYKYLGFDLGEEYNLTEFVKIVNSSYNPYINKDIGDGEGCIPGFIYQEISANGKTYYEYYWIKAFKFRNEIKCIRFRMGYKLGQDIPLQSGRIQEVTIFSPFHSYNGLFKTS